jgi:hypothetical protein
MDMEVETVEGVEPVEEVKDVETNNVEEVKEVEPENNNILIHDYKNKITFGLVTKSKEASTALIGHSLVINFAQTACEHHKFNSVNKLYELENKTDEYYVALQKLNMKLDDTFLDVDISNIPQFVRHCMKYIYRLNKDRYQNNEDKDMNVSEKDFINNTVNVFV